MKYRITALTPLLVGDGARLSPIDYMVWRDQVNVLDQHKIFRLLARGPRLESYLVQLRRADKLDFASWGGFAQNYADRRIPFEHPSSTKAWERAQADSLFIPTFSSGLNGAFLPGSAVKGALRTGQLFSRWKDGVPQPVAAQFEGERIPRRPAEAGEQREFGPAAGNQMRWFSVEDSQPVARASFKVYLIRVATLQAKGQERYELGWKTSPRGAVDGKRDEASTPYFAEMAAPGTSFEGQWRESDFLKRPEILKELRWRNAPERTALFATANDYAQRNLELHREYAATASLDRVAGSVDGLLSRLSEFRQNGSGCILPLGWGGGILTKAVLLDSGGEQFRKFFRDSPLYSRAVSTGMPFPKTRRIVFEGGQPSSLPGWVSLEVSETT